MMIRMSSKELERLGVNVPKNSSSKYRSKRVMVDGIYFDSQAEANYYCKLKLLLKSGDIDGFCRQAKFIVTEGRNGERGTEYITDFIIFYPNGKYRIVDVKGMKTEVFKLKVKCLREKYPKLNIEIEV